MDQYGAEVKDLDKIAAQKPLMFFGKDLREIKCFRKSIIYGICLGVVGGLATFMFTSKARFSTNMAFASLWLGVFGYWIPCRYKYETSLLRMEILRKEAMKSETTINESNSQTS